MWGGCHGCMVVDWKYWRQDRKVRKKRIDGKVFVWPKTRSYCSLSDRRHVKMVGNLWYLKEYGIGWWRRRKVSQQEGHFGLWRNFKSKPRFQKRLPSHPPSLLWSSFTFTTIILDMITSRYGGLEVDPIPMRDKGAHMTLDEQIPPQWPHPPLPPFTRRWSASANQDSIFRREPSWPSHLPFCFLPHLRDPFPTFQALLLQHFAPPSPAFLPSLIHH